MATLSFDMPRSYYEELESRRRSYRNKLLAKGVAPNSLKMLKLMCRKGL